MKLAFVRLCGLLMGAALVTPGCEVRVPGVFVQATDQGVAVNFPGGHVDLTGGTLTVNVPTVHVTVDDGR